MNEKGKVKNNVLKQEQRHFDRKWRERKKKVREM